MSSSLPAQSLQSSCIVTTRGGTADSLDVACQVECGNAEASAAFHFYATMAVPSPRDRELEIVFLVASNSDGRFATVHRKKVMLKEGTSSVRDSLPFTMNLNSDASGQRMQFWNVRVLEDQRDIEASRAIQLNPGSAYTPARLGPGEPPPYMMLQRGSQPGINLMILENGATLNSLPIAQSSPVVQDTPAFDLTRDVMRTTSIRHVNSLPDYWHYYTQFRWVVLTNPCFAQIRTERPRVAEALKHYIAAGGGLLLVDQPANAHKVIDDWLYEQAAEKPTYSAWEKPFELPNFSTLQTKPRYSEPPAAEDEEPGPNMWQGTSAREFGRGRIICWDNRSQSTSLNIMTLVSLTVGVSTSGAYDENWSLRNMIASVGKPPIWTFCAIVLLFGLILGPGLLTLTGWIGRRSLMILLVPLFSLAATLAIVCYEVLHEGFGTYARISAVLTIDEASGEAFAWSRQNYFSGWPPREGLAIPNHVFCRPVAGMSLGRSNMNRSSPDGQYTVLHEPEESRWLGALPPRAQKQFLIGHPLKTAMPIQIKRVDDKTISVRNLTNEVLPMVVCRDGKDGFYLTEKVAPNAEVNLEVQKFDDIAGTLSRLRSEHAPGFPPEMRSLGWATNTNQSSIEILDQTWQGALSEQASQSTLGPYGFVTLIHQCDDLFVPVKADSQESLILVTGRASW